MKLFCDLHIHSCLSPCGDALMTPNNIVGMAFIKQLDAIAVCDHNCARNLPAIKEVADMMNVLLLPGMELTTREEAHMLCYFRTVEECVTFGEQIYAHLPPIPNREAFFGRQQVMNAQDEEIAVEERLLMPGMNPNRADILPYGLAILIGFMHLSGAQALTISDRGNVYGFIKRMAGE